MNALGRAIGRLLAAPLYRAWAATWRVSFVDLAGAPLDGDRLLGRDAIFACCDRDALALLHIRPRTRPTAMVAAGEDGDAWALVARRRGWRVVRGSSRHGAAATYRRLRRAIEKPGGLWIAVDGPVGPPGRVAPGAIALAAIACRPLYVVGCAASRAITFRRSWSQMYLPAPGARVVCVVSSVAVTSDGRLKQGRAALAASVAVEIASSRAAAVRLVSREQAGLAGARAGIGARP